MVTTPPQRRVFHKSKTAIQLKLPIEASIGHFGFQPQNFVPIQKPILGMDTETIDGKCRLLCDSNSNVLDMYTIDDFLEFIELNEYETTINMFFNLDYDARSILRYFPQETLFDLHIFTEATYNDIKIRYIPRKKLTIRYNKKKYDFYGIFQFYLTGLNEASIKYVG